MVKTGKQVCQTLKCDMKTIACNEEMQNIMRIRDDSQAKMFGFLIMFKYMCRYFDPNRALFRKHKLGYEFRVLALGLRFGLGFGITNLMLYSE